MQKTHSVTEKLEEFDYRITALTARFVNLRAEWDENKHPRDDAGQFTTGGGGGGPAKRKRPESEYEYKNQSEYDDPDRLAEEGWELTDDDKLKRVRPGYRDRGGR